MQVYAKMAQMYGDGMLREMWSIMLLVYTWGKCEIWGSHGSVMKITILWVVTAM